MNTLNINGSNITICARYEALTEQKAIIRYSHNIREAKHTNKINYLRDDSFKNRYIVLSEFKNNGHMRELFKDEVKQFSDLQSIKNTIAQHSKIIIDDYEKQSYTDKNNRQKHKKFKSNMTTFSEIILTFGSTRAKAKKEGLNDDEAKLINSTDLMTYAKRFANMYSLKYHFKCLLIAEHNDEKTKHYQLIFTNYDMSIHKNLRFNGKAQTKKFGESLQDMAQTAFNGLVQRGLRGSKAKHKTLRQMHNSEKEFLQEQEFKKELRQLISKEMGIFVKKEKTLVFQKEYYRLDKKNIPKLLNSLTTMSMQKFGDQIYLFSDEELKQEVFNLLDELKVKEDIEQQNENLKQQNNELDFINNELQKQNKDLLDENQELTKQNKTDFTTIQTQEKDIMNLKQNITSQETQIKQLSQQNQYQQEILYKSKDAILLVKQNQDLLDENSELQRKLNTQTQTINNNQKQIQSLSDRLNTKQQTINDQENTIQSQKDSIDKLKKELSQFTIQNEQIIIQNKSLNDQIKALEDFKTESINTFKILAQESSRAFDLISKNIPEIKNEIRQKSDWDMSM